MIGSKFGDIYSSEIGNEVMLVSICGRVLMTATTSN